jgi:hypothetical protein
LLVILMTYMTLMQVMYGVTSGFSNFLLS